MKGVNFIVAAIDFSNHSEVIPRYCGDSGPLLRTSQKYTATTHRVPIKPRRICTVMTHASKGDDSRGTAQP